MTILIDNLLDKISNYIAIVLVDDLEPKLHSNYNEYNFDIYVIKRIEEQDYGLASRPRLRIVQVIFSDLLKLLEPTLKNHTLLAVVQN